VSDNFIFFLKYFDSPTKVPHPGQLKFSSGCHRNKNWTWQGRSEKL